MKFQHIILLIAMICGVQSTLQRYTTTSSEPEEQHCESTCKECFANPGDSLQRMGCYEKCIAEDVDQFTCPGSDSFLGAVDPPSQVLQTEVKEFFEKEIILWSAKDVQGIVASFTERDCTMIIDHQKPVIGRDGRAKQATDYFIANPEFDHFHLESIYIGEENGIIWMNGLVHSYDKQDQLISGWRIMSLLRRVGGELQDFTRVLFLEDE